MKERISAVKVLATTVWDWVESRTGVGGVIRAMVYHDLPGGARWRHVWSSTVLFALAVQAITGTVMWLYYSPGALSAWESVHFFNDKVAGGRFLRGIHHWMAQIMIVLLVAHLFQQVWTHAYRAPREIRFWLLVAVIFTTLGISFTGYIMPWDRKGFMAAQISSSLAGGTPLIGQELRAMMLGGPERGHLTLTRFSAAHTTLLPGILVALIALRAFLSQRFARRRQAQVQSALGIPVSATVRLENLREASAPLRGQDTTRLGHGPIAPWWPTQAGRDAIACGAVMVAVVALTWMSHGAALYAPGEPGLQDQAARPDWYFRPLYSMLHWPIFGGALQIIPSHILPGLAAGFLLMMPFIGRTQKGHRLNLAILAAGTLGYFGLAADSLYKDAVDPVFQAAEKDALAESTRIKERISAKGGVPPAGAVSFIEDDAVIQGKRLFVEHCSSCHSFHGHNGAGLPLGSPQSAAELGGWGSRQWLRDFLDPHQIEQPHWWGNTAFVKTKEGRKPSKMVKFIKEDIAEYSAEEKAKLEKVIAALSAEAGLASQAAQEQQEAPIIEEGRKLIGEGGLSCTDCHAYREEKGGKPDLTGWGSRQWTVDLIKNPSHERFYGSRNDRMPAYGNKGTLSERQIGWIVDWIRGEAK